MLPLEGIRVIEIAHYVAVPAAGALLADLGAEVIKIELPPRGEIYRRSRPKFAGYASEFPEGPAFHLDNRGKRSLMLDLTRPEARDALLRLVDRADVVTTNLLPARRKKYGLDHESLLARRPSLIVAAINGFGGRGAEANRPAFDYAAFWAASGLMDVMRDEGLRPSMLRPGIGDHIAASNLVVAILAALRMRDATGTGRYVEVSLLQTALWTQGCDIATALVTREPVRRHDRERTMNPLWNTYPLQDGRWIMLVMVDPTAYWPRLCEAIGRADLIRDPRFAEPFERTRHAPELIAEIAGEFAKHGLDWWRPKLDAAGLIWSPVQRIDEILDDAQAREMGYFRTLEHPTFGPFETLGPPLCIDGVDLGAKKACSPLDADARDVLAEAGLTPDQIAALGKE